MINNNRKNLKQNKIRNKNLRNLSKKKKINKDNK